MLATDTLGVPVSMSALRFHLLPTPHVALTDVVIGDKPLVKVARLKVSPSVWSMLSSTKVIDIHIKKVVVDEATLQLVERLLDAPRDEDAMNVRVRQVLAEEVEFVSANMKLPIFNLEAELDDAHHLQTAQLTTLDKQVTANITPQDNHSQNAMTQAIAITFNQWIVPIGAPFIIDKGKINAVLTPEKLAVQEIDLGLYGGKLTGQATLLIPQQNKGKWRLSSNLKLNDIAVKEPSRLVGGNVYLSGQLFGKGSVKSEAAGVGDLAKQLKAQLQFNINHGVLHGLDLIKVASLLVKQTKGGGNTAFEVFSGAVSASNGAYYLHNLKFSSGLIAGTGQVNILPNNKLDGKGEIELKKVLVWWRFQWK